MTNPLTSAAEPLGPSGPSMGLPFRVILIVCVLLIIRGIIIRRRRRELDQTAFVLWVIIWGAIGVVCVFPGTTSVLARWLGIGRGLDVVLSASVAAIFFLLFRVIARLERMERDLTRIVRQLALHPGRETEVTTSEPGD
jgi:small membrane protein